MPAVFLTPRTLLVGVVGLIVYLKTKQKKKKNNKPVQDERKMMKEQEIKSDS